MTWPETLHQYWQEVTAIGAFLNIVLMVATLAWVLTIKKDSTSAMAWCLVVFFIPFFGALFFLLFGYQHVTRPVSRKVKHRKRFRGTYVGGSQAATPGAEPQAADGSWDFMARLAQRFDAYPVTRSNRVAFYHFGEPAYQAMLDAIRGAKHHVHMETFIFQPDDSGKQFMDVMAEKARQGVEVRLLYDAMGSRRLFRNWLEPLDCAGGKCSPFLPLSLLRRRIQINLRNHRKIMVVDGRVGFTGGLNIGDEYVGKSDFYGYWRDTHIRVEGPVAAGLQRVFIEDWDFAAGEHLKGDAYFPPRIEAGAGEGLLCPAQMIESGPDQDVKGIREVIFAAILRARKRLWIASPYFVPDAGLRDALRMAGYMGVDVRLLCQFRPDQWVPFLAARYYWTDMLEAGVKVYQYTKGMMHAKVIIVDGEWATVGSANFDNRSMHLNFEVMCLLYSPEAVAELEEAFRRDFAESILIDQTIYAERPFAGRLVENACRLLSPVL